MAPRLGNVIRRHRQAKGLTQIALAKKVRVTREYIAMLETGARESPSLPMLKRIAKALGVPVGELLE